MQIIEQTTLLLMRRQPWRGKQAEPQGLPETKAENAGIPRREDLIVLPPASAEGCFSGER